MCRKGFTLIELLVVITIIVVLLALLTPALDRAIYQAELAVCGTHLKAIANGANIYAAGSNRYYPHNPYLAGTTPNSIWRGGAFESSFAAVWEEYISPNSTMNDPLNEDVDLTTGNESAYVQGDYWLFFGWAFAGDSGMLKLGNRFSYSYAAAEGTVSKSFGVIAGDFDYVFGQQACSTGHPDADGRMVSQSYQNEKRPDLFGSIVGANYTDSYYWLEPGVGRGTVDEHFAYTDGSVERFNEVSAYDNSLPPEQNDERMSQVQVLSTKGDATIVTNIPKN